MVAQDELASMCLAGLASRTSMLLGALSTCIGGSMLGLALIGASTPGPGPNMGAGKGGASGGGGGGKIGAGSGIMGGNIGAIAVPQSQSLKPS